MTNIGIVYPWVSDIVIQTLNQMIEDYQQKTIATLKKDFITAHRDLLPTDSIISNPAPVNFSTTATGGATVKVCNITVATEVKNDQAFLLYGWYANKNLGDDSRFWIQINDKVRGQVSAYNVWDSPGHFMLIPKLLLWGKEGDVVNFNIFNGLGAGNDVDGTFFPLVILFGEPGVLGVD